MVVRLQRSSRKGTRVSELTFEQWSDGRVHVEHVVRNGDDATTTKLDAGAWDILNAQNPELCRQLELVDEHGKLLVGLPLPSAETLRRDTLTALRDGGAPPDLVKRLLQLRLATRVKSQAELESVLHVEPTRTTPQVAPPSDVRARIAALEKETRSRRENRLQRLRNRIVLQETLRELTRRRLELSGTPPSEHTSRRASGTRKTSAAYLENTPSKFFEVPRSPPQADCCEGFVR